MNRTQKLYGVCALLWSITGLLYAISGNVSLAMMNICIGMMFVTFSCSKKICGVKTDSKPDAQPKA